MCKIRLLASILVCMVAVAGCQEATKVRECLPLADYTTLQNELKSLEGVSEYDILGQYGKPQNVSMNTRSEKDYYYKLCADTSALTLVLRFTSTGRVKEGFSK